MQGSSFSSDYFKSNRLESTRVRTESLEPLGLLHVAVTPGTLVCQVLKDIQRLLAIDITQVGPRSLWCTGNESQTELAEHFLVRCPRFGARRASSLLPLFYFRAPHEWEPLGE